MYEYRGKVNRVVDGDTIDVDVDLGFSIYSKQRFRLLNINTPEVVGKERVEGIRAKNFVEEMLPVGKVIFIRSHKDKKGKYGRYLVDIYFEHEGREIYLNDYLVKKGYAVYYD